MDNQLRLARELVVLIEGLHTANPVFQPFGQHKLEIVEEGIVAGTCSDDEEGRFEDNRSFFKSRCGHLTRNIHPINLPGGTLNCLGSKAEPLTEDHKLVWEYSFKLMFMAKEIPPEKRRFANLFHFPCKIAVINEINNLDALVHVCDSTRKIERSAQAKGETFIHFDFRNLSEDIDFPFPSRLLTYRVNSEGLVENLDFLKPIYEESPAALIKVIRSFASSRKAASA